MIWSVGRMILRTSGSPGDSLTSGGCRTDMSAFVVGALILLRCESYGGQVGTPQQEAVGRLKHDQP